jgi:hypothetical protein
MEQRFPSKKTHITDVATMENRQRIIETIRVNPLQLTDAVFVIGKIAEIAGRVAGIGDSHIQESRPAARR